MCLYKRYIICLISFFNLHEFFPDFICGNNIGSLVIKLFGIKIFNPVPFFISWGFDFTLSAIISYDGNCIDNGDDDDLGLDICFVVVLCISLNI